MNHPWRFRPLRLALLLSFLPLLSWQLAAGSAPTGGTAPEPVWPGAVTAPGVVEPVSRLVALRAGVPGRLARVTVQSGEPVREGQLLAELENEAQRQQVALRRAGYRQARARLEQLQSGARAEERARAQAASERAEAARDLARLELARTERLAQAQAATPQALDEARAQLKSAGAELAIARATAAELEAGARPEELQAARAAAARALAAWREAQAQLALTRIVSPLDGVCVYRHREPGEAVGYAADTEPVLTVASDGPPRVRVDVDARDLARVRPGQPVTVSASAWPGLSLQGEVLRVERTAGRKNLRTERPRERLDTKVVEVLVQLQEAEPTLPFGLEVTARFSAAAPDGEPAPGAAPSRRP